MLIDHQSNKHTFYKKKDSKMSATPKLKLDAIFKGVNPGKEALEAKFQNFLIEAANTSGSNRMVWVDDGKENGGDNFLLGSAIELYSEVNFNAGFGTDTLLLDGYTINSLGDITIKEENTETTAPDNTINSHKTYTIHVTDSKGVAHNYTVSDIEKLKFLNKDGVAQIVSVASLLKNAPDFSQNTIDINLKLNEVAAVFKTSGVPSVNNTYTGKVEQNDVLKLEGCRSDYVFSAYGKDLIKIHDYLNKKTIYVKNFDSVEFSTTGEAKYGKTSNDNDQLVYGLALNGKRMGDQGASIPVIAVGTTNEYDGSTDGNDYFRGSSRNDNISGGKGDDVFVESKSEKKGVGYDRVDGEEGNDLFIAQGKRGDYNIKKIEANGSEPAYYEVYNKKTRSTTRLYNIERIRFNKDANSEIELKPSDPYGILKPNPTATAGNDTVKWSAITNKKYDGLGGNDTVDFDNIDISNATFNQDAGGIKVTVGNKNVTLQNVEFVKFGKKTYDLKKAFVSGKPPEVTTTPTETTLNGDAGANTLKFEGKGVKGNLLAGNDTAQVTTLGKDTKIDTIDGGNDEDTIEFANLTEADIQSITYNNGTYTLKTKDGSVNFLNFEKIKIGKNTYNIKRVEGELKLEERFENGRVHFAKGDAVLLRNGITLGGNNDTAVVKNIDALSASSPAQFDGGFVGNDTLNLTALGDAKLVGEVVAPGSTDGYFSITLQFTSGIDVQQRTIKIRDIENLKLKKNGEDTTYDADTVADLKNIPNTLYTLQATAGNDTIEYFGNAKKPASLLDGNDTAVIKNLGSSTTFDVINGGEGEDLIDLSSISVKDIKKIEYDNASSTYTLTTTANKTIQFLDFEKIKIGKNTYNIERGSNEVTLEERFKGTDVYFGEGDYPTLRDGVTFDDRDNKIIINNIQALNPTGIKMDQVATFDGGDGNDTLDLSMLGAASVYNKPEQGEDGYYIFEFTFDGKFASFRIKNIENLVLNVGGQSKNYNIPNDIDQFATAKPISGTRNLIIATSDNWDEYFPKTITGIAGKNNILGLSGSIEDYRFFYRSDFSPNKIQILNNKTNKSIYIQNIDKIGFNTKNNVSNDIYRIVDANNNSFGGIDLSKSSFPTLNFSKSGTNLGDLLYGTIGNDKIDGSGGDDTFFESHDLDETSNGTIDSIDGGSGINNFIASGSFSQYEITKTEINGVAEYTLISSDDTKTFSTKLKNVKYIRFTEENGNVLPPVDIETAFQYQIPQKLIENTIIGNGTGATISGSANGTYFTCEALGEANKNKVDTYNGDAGVDYLDIGDINISKITYDNGTYTLTTNTKQLKFKDIEKLVLNGQILTIPPRGAVGSNLEDMFSVSEGIPQVKFFGGHQNSLLKLGYEFSEKTALTISDLASLPDGAIFDAPVGIGPFIDLRKLVKYNSEQQELSNGFIKYTLTDPNDNKNNRVIYIRNCVIAYNDV